MPTPSVTSDLSTLQALFAASSDLVIVTGSDGAVAYTNAPTVLPGASLFEQLLPGVDVELMQRQVLAGGRPLRVEVPSRRDGEPCWLLLTVSPIAQGEGLLFVGADITGRHHEEDRLRRIEELMLDTEGIAHFGVWEWDITQPVANWSLGLYRIYGLTPQTYTPSYEEYLKRVHPDDRQRVMDATDAVFHRHQPYSHDERIFHADGSIRYLHTWAVPVLGPDGALQRLMGVCLDITDRKLAEMAVAEHAERLSDLNRELESRVEERTRELYVAKTAAETASAGKSLFLATMSHEVRTPMNGVLGMLELLMEEELQPEHQRMLTTVRDSSDALLTILDDILDFSKIEAGRMTLESIPVNMRRIVDGVADTLAANAQYRQLQLYSYVDPALPDWLLGDQVRLRQILFNLGSNAIKFTETTADRAGVVRIRVDRDEAPLPASPPDAINLVISVADNGIGMDVAKLNDIFTPFTQAESSTTRRFGGSGLGLSICKYLVDLMGGSLSVTSVPGQGTTFRVQLALAPADGPAISDPDLLVGLRVIVLAEAGEMARTLADYATAAGALLESHADLAAFDAAVMAAADMPGQPLVLLFGPEHTVAEVAARLPQWRAASLHAGMQAVLLTARREGIPAEGVLQVHAWPLHQDELVDALAAAAGRPRIIPSAADRVNGLVVRARPPAERPLVLLAEDNPVNQEIARRQLEFLGYRCMVADNGLKALELLPQHPFALLITDCQMPEMDGLALTQTIRASERDGDTHLPIIALTANALRGEAERCLRVGMDDYLCKPVRLATLEIVLARWLNQPAGVDVSSRS